jgi:peptidoglycan/xylan/chitin deacetylase (PgdA/CDA1 family)
LNVNGRIHEWSLDGAVHSSEESGAQRRLSHEGKEKSDSNQRRFLYRSLHQLLRPMPNEVRRGLLDELVAWAGGGSVDNPTHYPLSPSEAIRLAEGNLIEVGAHTVTHPVLSGIPVDLQQSEITHGKAHLEDILGRSVASFAYPFGARSDYTQQTVAIVRDAGFTSACSSFSGRIRKGISLYQLPRYAARDWSGEAFEWQLARWFCD